MKMRILPLAFSLLLMTVGLSFAGNKMLSRPWRPYLLERDSYSTTVTHLPAPRHDSRISPKMVLASKIAEQRAVSHPSLLCWRYVKKALLEAHAVEAYPATVNARQAGGELVSRYGFVKLPIGNPNLAPVGSVLVYAGHGPGHVELRTENGFVSDFRSTRACPWQLLGVYAKLSS